MYSSIILKINPSGILVEFLNGTDSVYKTIIQTIDWNEALTKAILEFEEI